MKRRLRSTVTTLVGLSALVLAQVLPAAPAVAQTAPVNPAPPPGYPQPPPNAYPPPPSGYYPPPPGYYPPQPYALPPPGYARPKQRRSKGLLIAGPIVLAATYGFTALVGLTLLSRGDGLQSDGTICLNCETEGHRLLIPILGPWLAIPAADGSDGKTLCAVMGLAQATGVLLTIIGISRYSASAPEGNVASTGLHFAFVPRSGGGLGVLGSSF